MASFQTVLELQITGMMAPVWKALLAVVATMTLHSINAETIKIHCQGDGPELYLVGGGPAFTTWNLQPIQEQLSKHYRVCRWDMRGVGDNADLPFSGQGTALSQWLNDMSSVLPQQRVLLWGHSWGALQVLLYASLHPQRVQAIILSNPVDPELVSLEGIENKRFQDTVLADRLDLDDIGTEREALYLYRSKIASYFADSRSGWKYAAGFDLDDSNSALNIRIWQEYRNSPLSKDQLRQAGAKLEGLIYCREDVLYPENLHVYRKLLPTVPHRVIEGCGHFPWEERPGQYFPVLLELLEAGRE